nr:Unknown Function [uncultured bacterium]
MSILDDSLSHLETNAVGQPSVKTSQSPKGKRAFVFGAVALVVVMAVFISVKLTQTEQDISNKAAVDQGQVLVTSTASSLAVGQPTTVTLKANTQGVNVNGIQLTFTIDTSQSQPLTSPPTASIVASSGMTIAASAINQMPSGMYQVILYIVANQQQFFSSTTPRDFATIVFTPTSSGTISFQFDNVDSLAPTANTGVDTLHTIQPMNFSVASNVSPTNTPIACPTAPTCGAAQTLIVIDPVNLK